MFGHNKGGAGGCGAWGVATDLGVCVEERHADWGGFRRLHGVTQLDYRGEGGNITKILPGLSSFLAEVIDLHIC